MTDTSNTKVIVGMSGGVDSSVSAYLLLQQGYQVEGLFMKNWDEDDGTELCTAIQDFEDAQQVAETIGIAWHQTPPSELRRRVLGQRIRALSA